MLRSVVVLASAVLSISIRQRLDVAALLHQEPSGTVEATPTQAPTAPAPAPDPAPATDRTPAPAPATTDALTPAPTVAQTDAPTPAPTVAQTDAPTTQAATAAPTGAPTTQAATQAPAPATTFAQTDAPTTQAPAPATTVAQTDAPTTQAATAAPTGAPMPETTPAPAPSYPCQRAGDVDADKQNDCVSACYRGADGDAGCVPQEHASHIDLSEPGCLEHACWCLAEMCNTEEWYTEFKRTYVPPPPPPLCYIGMAGTGPSCQESQLGKDRKYEMKDCHSRALSKICVENNQGAGRGDGCPRPEGEHDDANNRTLANRDEASCLAYRPNERNPEDSWDRSTRHCRWIPEQTKEERSAKCGQDDDGIPDDACHFYEDRGPVDPATRVQQGECQSAESAMQKENTWREERGMECDKRLKSGCFENNEWMGDSDRCTSLSSQDTCLAKTTDCSEGICSGTSTGLDLRSCESRRSNHECDPTLFGASEGSGCSWTPQCCQWLPEPADKSQTCSTKGAGTLEGVCEYNDGGTPPGPEMLALGFKHGGFTKSPSAKFHGHCALVATFRNGVGSAVALNSDKANMIQGQSKEWWQDVAEHIDHTRETVEEYVNNFVPDASAMAAISTHSIDYIIKKAKEGQFDAILHGLEALLYIVTEAPNIGECLFFSERGNFGAALCTCASAECNDQSALDSLVNQQTGPMRLLRFLDGTLVEKKDAINEVVPDLLDAQGKLNPAKVNDVTEAHIDDIMTKDGISDLTNKEELWGICQDYQRLLKAEAAYKTGLLQDNTFQALKIDPLKVAAANLAGCPLDSADTAAALLQVHQEPSGTEAPAATQAPAGAPLATPAPAPAPAPGVTDALTPAPTVAQTDAPTTQAPAPATTVAQTDAPTTQAPAPATTVAQTDAPTTQAATAAPTTQAPAPATTVQQTDAPTTLAPRPGTTVAQTVVDCCPLYSADGTPNTYCLQNLAEDSQQAVADAAGVTKENLQAGTVKAKSCEEQGNCQTMGTELQAPTTPVPGTAAPTRAPGTPAPGTPSPGTRAPGTPAPGAPSPGTQAPGTPAPGAPSPGTPSPDGTEPTTGPSPSPDFPCHRSGDVDDQDECFPACFRSFKGDPPDAGCVPYKIADNADISEAGCSDMGCWCLEEMCNTAEWLTEFRRAYEPPPKCFAGVAGTGPSCKESALGKEHKYKKPDCRQRSLHNMCVENNDHAGEGDGCPRVSEEPNAAPRNRSSCESYRAHERDKDRSADKTTRHCRWLDRKTSEEQELACAPTSDSQEKETIISYGQEAYEDASCVFRDGQCQHSPAAHDKEQTWKEKRGMKCRERLNFGCFENNEWMGESDRCTDETTQDTCLAKTTDCSEGSCSGTAEPSSTNPMTCMERRSSNECNDGCVWTPQCCQWVPKPADKANTCMTKGAGRLAGVCEYNDGGTLPDAEVVSMGFEHGLFTKGPKFTGSCGLIATFRNGFGSAVALNTDKANMVRSLSRELWKDVAGHVDHSKDSVDEYFNNFVPDGSAMEAISRKSAGYIVDKAKQGQFHPMMKGLKDSLYIVSASWPELGQCLFFAKHGKFGAVICKCESAECNNKAAVETLVGAQGPMRLLVFLDGTLLDKKDSINSIVPGLLDSEGKIISGRVASVTEADMDRIMEVDGVADLFTRDELRRICEDYQVQLLAEDRYKNLLNQDSTFSKLKLKAKDVDVANAAADPECPLYGADGTPNTVCLQNLASGAQGAVASATGIAEMEIEAGVTKAKQCEESGGMCAGDDVWNVPEPSGARSGLAISGLLLLSLVSLLSM